MASIRTGINNQKSATMKKYQDYYVLYASIKRTYGYGQYVMQCEWHKDGELHSSSLHTTDSRLYDDYHCSDGFDERYEYAQQLIAERVIDNYYSI